jgi:hypothetical protein
MKGLPAMPEGPFSCVSGIAAEKRKVTRFASFPDISLLALRPALSGAPAFRELPASSPLPATHLPYAKYSERHR